MQNPGDFLADQERLLRKRSSRSINSPVTASAVKLSVAPSDPRLLEKSGHSRSFFSTGNDTTTLFKIALGLLGGLSLVLGVAVVMLINALGSRSGGNILLNASTGPTYVVEQNKIMYPNGTARTFSFGKREDVAAADAALAAASLVTVETKWPSADDAVVPAEPPIPHGLPSAVMAALPASFSDFLTDGVMGSSSTQFGVANATNMTKLDGEVDIAGVGATVYTRCYTRTVFGSATATTQQPSTSSAPTMTMKPPASNPPSENWYFQLGSYFGRSQTPWRNRLPP